MSKISESRPFLSSESRWTRAGGLIRNEEGELRWIWGLLLVMGWWVPLAGVYYLWTVSRVLALVITIAIAAVAGGLAVRRWSPSTVVRSLIELIAGLLGLAGFFVGLALAAAGLGKLYDHGHHLTAGVLIGLAVGAVCGFPVGRKWPSWSKRWEKRQERRQERREERQYWRSISDAEREELRAERAAEQEALEQAERAFERALVPETNDRETPSSQAAEAEAPEQAFSSVHASVMEEWRRRNGGPGPQERKRLADAERTGRERRARMEKAGISVEYNEHGWVIERQPLGPFPFEDFTEALEQAEALASEAKPQDQ